MELLIFDLDGTLIDSAEDIRRSVNELRHAEAHEPLPRETIEAFIGNGIRRLIERAMPESRGSTLDRAVARYREIYRRRLLESTRAYPGVEAALEALAAREGLRLSVLTNKPLAESEAILTGLGLRRHFDAVFGGDSFERKKPDPVGVHHLLEMTGARPDRVLFVGDSTVDLETARCANVRFCLVSYGIGSNDVTGVASEDRVTDLRELCSPRWGMG